MTTLLRDLLLGILFACVMLAFTTIGQTATEGPAEIRMPDTRPEEAGNFESPDKCDRSKQYTPCLSR